MAETTEIPQIISVNNEEIVIDGIIPEETALNLWMPIKKHLQKKLSMTCTYTGDTHTNLRFYVDFRSAHEQTWLLQEASTRMAFCLDRHLSELT
jgi:hypothetical protein